MWTSTTCDLTTLITVSSRTWSYNTAITAYFFSLHSRYSKTKVLEIPRTMRNPIVQETCLGVLLSGFKPDSGTVVRVSSSLHFLHKLFLPTAHTAVGISDIYNVHNTIIIFQLRTAVLGLIVRSGLDVPTFATRRLHACHHVRAPSGGRWNCGREMSDNFA